MPTCSDRGIILKLSGKSASSKTFLSAADGAEVKWPKDARGEAVSLSALQECHDDARRMPPEISGQLAASEAAA